jgi:hypothetical protein
MNSSLSLSPSTQPSQISNSGAAPMASSGGPAGEGLGQMNTAMGSSEALIDGSSRDEAGGSDVAEKPEGRIGCIIQSGCDLDGKDFRKIVSHVFGRNKKCTSQIPPQHFIWYCRKHYQRLRYHSGPTWASMQIGLVRKQLALLDSWGGVQEWVIALSESAKKRLNQDNAELAKRAKDGKNSSDAGAVFTNSAKPLPGDPIRFLVTYLGRKKTYRDVCTVVDVIEREFERRAQAGHTAPETFPPVEFLPSIDDIRYPTKAQREKAKKEAKEKAEVGGAQSGEEKLEAEKLKEGNGQEKKTHIQNSEPEVERLSVARNTVSARPSRTPLSSQWPSSSAYNFLPENHPLKLNSRRELSVGLTTRGTTEHPVKRGANTQANENCKPVVVDYPFIQMMRERYEKLGTTQF